MPEESVAIPSQKANILVHPTQQNNLNYDANLEMLKYDNLMRLQRISQKSQAVKQEEDDERIYK